MTTMRVPGADMRRHHRADAVREHRRLVGRGGRLALHRRLGLDDLERHPLRQLDRDRVALEDREHAGHALLEVDRLVADHVARDGDLLVALRVHEDVVVAVLVEVGVLAVLDEGALDLLGGLVALRRLHPVGDAAHVDLGRRRALAREEAFGREDGVELAVDLEDVALADGAGDDSHGCLVVGLANAQGRAQGLARLRRERI